MRKRILLLLGFFTILGTSLMGQAVEGGAGVVFVDADPNTISALEDVSANEANIAYNRTTQMLYVFDPSGTAGTDQWIAVDVTSTVTSVVGANDITVTNVGGTYTVDFTETTTSIAWNATTNTLTYTDEDGNDTDLDLSGSTDVSGSSSISVSGSGTAASPYVITLAGAATAASGEVPTSDGSGGLTWRDLVASAAFTSTGELQLTLTDGSTVLVNMENIPTVADKSELDAAAAAVDGTSGGVARAANLNTFGMPATADYGVLFFISN